MNMASVCVTRFGQVGRRTAVKLMVIGAVGIMTLAGTNPAMAASDDQASFWTQFTPSADTRLIFVSSSDGNDSNSGLTPATPVKTIAKGYQLLRDGSPDWMLLKRGDTWIESLPNWMKSGRSETEKMVLGAYGEGSGRPQVRPPAGAIGMNAVGNTKTDHVAFVGFHLEPLDRADDQCPTGFRWLRRGEDILFEDLYVAGWGNNFTLQAFGDGVVLENFRINGCVVVDAWSKTMHSQGIYASGNNGLVIENSIFASNGFNVEREAQPTMFNHNIYVSSSNQNIVVKNNIIADASSHGIQLRPGGEIYGNVFLSNPIAVLFGSNLPSTSPVPGGVEGGVERNLIMYGRGIDSNLPRSWGIDITNCRGAVVSENILYKSEIGYNGQPIQVGDGREYGVVGVSVVNNWIVGWNGPVTIGSQGDAQHATQVEFRGNRIWRDLNANNGNNNLNRPFLSVFDAQDSGLEIDDNWYGYLGMHSRPFTSADTNFSVDSWSSDIEPSSEFVPIFSVPSSLEISNYLGSIGLSGGLDEFLSEARRQSRQNFRSELHPSVLYQWARHTVSQ